MKTKEEIKALMGKAIGTYDNTLTDSIVDSCADVTIREIINERYSLHPQINRLNEQTASLREQLKEKEEEILYGLKISVENP